MMMQTTQVSTFRIRGRMVEMGLTQEKIAWEMDLAKTIFNQKLDGVGDWTRKEIIRLCDVLEIKPERIADYFFCD